MLKNLLKYEMQATSRIFGGLYLALILSSVMLLVSFRIRSSWSDMPVQVMIFIYVAFAIAIVVVTIVTIIQRFAKNLLGGEGYLMFTLPVSESQLIASKVISAILWCICDVVVGSLSFVLVTFMSKESLSVWGEIFNALRTHTELIGWMLMLALIVLATAAHSILKMYASCMIGHQFKRHMVGVSIIAYFIFGSIESLVGNVLSIGLNILRNELESFHLGSYFVAGIYMTLAEVSVISMLLTLAYSLVLGTIYFALTERLMHKRLNLE